MQPGVSCAGGGQGAQLPPPRGAVCVCVCVCVCVLGGCCWARLMLKLKGGAKAVLATHPQGSFQMPREGPGLPAFRQDGVAGSNHAYAVPGATGLCLGNVWHLIHGSW